MAYLISIDAGEGLDLPLDLAELERVAQATLVAQGAPEGASLSVVLVNDAEIADLNRAYRGLDEPTDVLAFAAQEGEPLVLDEGAPQELGDVIISVETAGRQAKALGHPLAAELALLVVHGCLHLLGYDHDEPDSFQKMWALQAAILASCGYPDVGADRPELYEQADDA